MYTHYFLRRNYRKRIANKTNTWRRIAVGLCTAGTLPSLVLSCAGQYFVNTAVFCLQVFQLHNILETVDCAAKIDLPNGWIAFVSVLPGMDRPGLEKSRVAFPVVAPLLGVYPRHFEDSLLLIQPFQPGESTGSVDHTHQPFAHTFRSLRLLFTVATAPGNVLRRRRLGHIWDWVRLFCSAGWEIIGSVWFQHTNKKCDDWRIPLSLYSPVYAWARFARARKK